MGEGDDEEEREIVRLANRLAGPLTKSKDVRRQYGVKEGSGRRAVRRVDTQ